MQAADHSLIGIGLYTLAEAGSLIGVAPAKLSRWLRGHAVRGEWYEPLWTSEIDLGDDKTYLSFRDLLEARAAAAFINVGLSPQRVRTAIGLARAMVGNRPLSTTWLRTDGRTVFLKVVEEDGTQPRMIDLFRGQYAFSEIVEQSLKNIEFEGSVPKLWWLAGRRAGVLIDPARSFGQPIEAETSIPATILANAITAEGSVEKAARAWGVSPASVRRAASFQREIVQKLAA